MKKESLISLLNLETLGKINVKLEKFVDTNEKSLLLLGYCSSKNINKRIYWLKN